MMPLDFIALAQQCAPQVSPVTMAAIVRTESGFQPVRDRRGARPAGASASERGRGGGHGACTGRRRLEFQRRARTGEPRELARVWIERAERI